MGRLVKGRGRVVPAAVLDATGEARGVVAAARRQADQLLAEARAEAAAVRAAAHQTARDELEAEFTTLLLAARADAERVRAAAVPAARGLAVRMAEKILGRTIELSDEVVTDIAGGALAAARARAGVVTLRIHPADRAAVERARPALATRLNTAVELRVVDDPTVGRGGCVVDTPVGRLDARLETQLAALERAAFPDAAAAPSLEQEGRRG